MANELVRRIDAVAGGGVRRVEIFRRDDGLYQFLERPWAAPELDSPSAAHWGNLHRSGLYASRDEAEREAEKFIRVKRPDPLRD